MADIRINTFVNAPPELVFSLWIDTERMPAWIEGLSKVTDVSGPMDQAGTTYVAWFGRMASRNEILEVDPPRFIRTRLGSWLLRGVTEATFEPEGGGTRVTQRFQTEGLLPSTAARLFAMGSWRGSFRGELATFARLAEQAMRAP